MLEKEGVDLLEISGGNYEAGIFQEAVDTAEVCVSHFPLNAYYCDCMWL